LNVERRRMTKTASQSLDPAEATGFALGIGSGGRRLVEALGIGRIIALAAVGLAILGLFGWLVYRAAEPPYTLLFGELEPDDGREVIARLETMGVPYRLTPDGRAVMVPGGEAPRIRMALAQEGLPNSGPAGYELLDGSNVLTTSDFLANVNLKRALEGELARTIAELRPVREARVHISQPRRELFERERQAPSASVFLVLRPGATLEPRQGQGIRHLVAAAVPSLEVDKVTIVDDRGNLLARSTDESGGSAVLEASEVRIAFEERLRQKVLNILERSVGVGRVLVEVNADLDLDAETTMVERFDPDAQVPRSVQSIEETMDREDTEGTPPVTVGNNLPTERVPASNAGGSREHTSRTEETTNFEISRTVRNHVRQGPRIRRLWIAVQVDGITQTGPDGQSESVPRPAAELEQLTALVRSAAGIDDERGDVVEIVSRPFAVPEFVDGTSSAEGWAWLTGSRLPEIVAVLLLALGLAVFALRPMLRDARAIATGEKEALAGPEARPALGAPGDPLAPGVETGAPGLPEVVPLEPVAQDEQLPMAGKLNVRHIDGLVRVKLVEEIADIIHEHPDEAVKVLRFWLNAE
jgi:flagellar M-ring protein FliF